MERKEYILTIVVSLISLAIAFAAGYIFHGIVNPPELELPILSEAQDILINFGLYDLPEDPALEYGMIHGMVQAYGDPYTVFLEPPQQELETQRLEGKFGGIGASLDRDSENYFILYPFQDGPANLAGMKDGDRLVEVDGIEITPETSFEDAVVLIRGPEGEKVNIVVHRPPEYERYEFTIKRVDYPLPSVTWHLAQEDARIGIVEINLIASSTPEEIETAIEDLKIQAATHFVLDLRGNGGGYLDAGVEIARMFLEEGIIIEQQYKGEDSKVFKVNKKGKYWEIPLVVLVDHYTASASEIVAGALQNHSRALLIGTPTFGKNTIQLIYVLEDSSSLHITGANWWIPGLDFPGEDYGLYPDILLSPDAEGSNPIMDLVIGEFFGD